jgi:hypothetical protein
MIDPARVAAPPISLPMMQWCDGSTQATGREGPLWRVHLVGVMLA